jgi:hypothetical protein
MLSFFAHMSLHQRVAVTTLVWLCLFFGVTPAVLAQGPDGGRLIIGQDFTLGPGEQVDGDLAILGGDAILEPKSLVDGGLALLGGDLQVGGTVAGDVVVFGGNIHLEETAVIQGSLAAIGSTVKRDSGARVEGELFDSPTLPIPPEFSRPDLPLPLPPLEAPRRPPSTSFWLWPLQAFGWSLFMAFLAALGVLVAPRGVGRIANAAAAQPLMSFAVGFVVLVAAALLGLVLLICCCLGLLVWVAVWLAVVIGWIGVGLWVGQAVLSAFRVRDVASFLEAALGAFLITFASRLPFCIGTIAWLVIAALGLGAVVLTRFGTRAHTGGLTGDQSADLLMDGAMRHEDPDGDIIP